jgi:hypothetical protein
MTEAIPTLATLGNKNTSTLGPICVTLTKMYKVLKATAPIDDFLQKKVFANVYKLKMRKLVTVDMPTLPPWVTKHN